MLQRTARLAAGLLAGAALTACSSAPLPEALTQEPSATPGGALPGGTTGTTGSPGTTGGTGTSTGVGTTGGGPAGNTGGTGSASSGGTTGVGGTTTGPSAVPGLFTPAEDSIGITKD